MKKFSFFKLLLCLVLAFSFSLAVFQPAYGEGEESESLSESVPTYTVSYGKGIYISYNGAEPNNFIKGTPPASQTVEQNGSVVVASNTFTFRDYSFGGWRYTYTDASGSKKTKYYNAGDVIQNVSSNMKLEATWTKKKEALKVGAFLIYANTNLKTEHYVGEIISLKKAPPAPSENHQFCGWTDNDGSVLYSAGDSYEIKNVNTVISPVWSVNGEKINYRKVSVEIKGGGSSSLSQIFILSGTSQSISFAPDEGYFLSSLSVGGEPVKAEHTLTVTAADKDIYIEAVFEKIRVPEPNVSEGSDASEEEKNVFNVTVITEGKGSVSPSQNITVNKGESVTLTFTPDGNYILPNELWHNEKRVTFGNLWDGVYTIENVTEDHEIKINFFNPDFDESSSSESSEDVSSGIEKFDFTYLLVILIPTVAIIFGIIAVGKNNKKSSKKRK